MADALQMILFSNNATEIAFSDGTKLQMSPCGISFVHDSPTSQDAHPLHGMSRITQRTQYTTSEFTDKVTKALEFRNLFSDRPFLCQERIPKDLTETLYEDICVAKWPQSVEKAMQSIRPYDKSSIRITSLCKNAHLTLSAHGKDFTVQYRAKLSQPISKENAQVRLHRKKDNSDASNDDSSDSQKSEQDIATKLPTKVRWKYTWCVQYHSVVMCPDHWKHPLNLLLEYKMQTEKPDDWNKSDSSGTVREQIGVDLNARAESDSSEQEEREKLESVPVENGKEVNGVAEGEIPKDVSRLSRKLGDHEVSERKHENATAFNEQSLTNGKEASPDSEGLPGDEISGVGAKTSDCGPDGSSISETSSDSGHYLDIIETSLPTTLPLQCSRHHLHKWRKQDSSKDYDTDAYACCFYKRIRVICSEGVIYRLSYNGSKLLEVYPGDGSVMVSKSFNSDFFIHYLTRGNQVEERTYSLRNPPPNSCNFPYSVERLIKRGYRIMRCVTEASESSLGKEDPPCWQDQADIIKPKPTVLEVEHVVPDVGKFSAYSNGRIRIVYTDRTCLDMMCGLERGRKQVEALGKRIDVKQIMPSLCRMLMPSGHYTQVQVHDPGDCSRYIDLAKEWVEWLITPKENRVEVFGQNIHETTEECIQQELKKIKCFNYILDNVVLPNQENKPTESPTGKPLTDGNQIKPIVDELPMSNFSLAAIQEVLKKTSQAINDIDSFCSVPKTN